MSMPAILDAYTRIFPIDTAYYYYEFSNMHRGPFMGPQSPVSPYWANHEDIVTAEGFTFPETPTYDDTWPMLLPNRANVKAILLDNNNKHTSWVKTGSHYQYTAVSPDGTKAAILNLVDPTSSNLTYGVAVFDVKTSGDFDADFASEVHLPVNPLGWNTILPVALAIDDSGDFYIGGYIYPTGATPERLVIRKYSSEGVLQWTSSWYAEEEDVYPPIPPVTDSLWGVGHWNEDEFPWEAADFLDNGWAFKVEARWCSRVPTDIQVQLQVATDSAFSTIIYDDTEYSASPDGTVPLTYFYPTWGDLGYSVSTPIETSPTGINLYVRARVIVNSVTGGWSSVKKMHIWLTFGAGYRTPTSSSSIETPYPTWPTYTLHYLKYATLTPAPPCDMHVVGANVVVAFGGHDKTFDGTYANYYTPNYVAYNRVWLFSVPTAGGTIVREVIDDYASSNPYSNTQSTSLNAGIEMLADGSDIYLCPSVMAPTPDPAYLLVRHNGTWTRLHLHLPSGTTSWWTLGTGTNHLFKHADKVYFLGQGDQQTANQSALCWLYAELDPSVEDQNLVRKDMPQFTYVYNGVTYYYGYWGGSSFSVSFDGNHIYTSGFESASAATMSAYILSAPQLIPAEVRVFSYTGRFRTCKVP